MSELIISLDEEDCEDFGTIVREMLDYYKKHHTKSSQEIIAHQLGMARSTFSRILNGEKSPETIDVDSDLLDNLIRLLHPPPKLRIQLLESFECHKANNRKKIIREENEKMKQVQKKIDSLRNEGDT